MTSAQSVSALFERVASHESDMVDTLSNLVRIPALGPRNGGDGETKKAQWLTEHCKTLGFEVEEYAAPDDEVPSGKRPSLVVRARGRDPSRTLWVMSHLDVVPPGNESDWKTPPFEPVLDDGKLYGRGTEDNGQSLVASLWALKSVLEEGATPSMNVALLFVADEETGSHKGLHWLLKEHPELFQKTDLFLVPDGGEPTGAKIEVSEKTILWLKFTVQGQQCHASMPYLGTNAARAAARLTTMLDDRLHASFGETDPLFNPPESTFEPTRREANVPNVNTIPGKEVFYFDNRLLPKYASDAVLSVVRDAVAHVEKLDKVRITMDVAQHDPAAPPTATDSEIVRRLAHAIKQLRPKLNPEPWGVGGGTVAAIFRRHGYPAAVWGTYDELAHSPNEYAKVSNIVDDAKVYAHLFTQSTHVPSPP